MLCINTAGSGWAYICSIYIVYVDTDILFTKSTYYTALLLYCGCVYLTHGWWYPWSYSITAVCASVLFDTKNTCCCCIAVCLPAVWIIYTAAVAPGAILVCIRTYIRHIYVLVRSVKSGNTSTICHRTLLLCCCFTALWYRSPLTLRSSPPYLSLSLSLVHTYHMIYLLGRQKRPPYFLILDDDTTPSAYLNSTPGPPPILGGWGGQYSTPSSIRDEIIIIAVFPHSPRIIMNERAALFLVSVFQHSQ